jgi:hypothetical protein
VAAAEMQRHVPPDGHLASTRRLQQQRQADRLMASRDDVRPRPHAWRPHVRLARRSMENAFIGLSMNTVVISASVNPAPRRARMKAVNTVS